MLDPLATVNRFLHLTSSSGNGLGEAAGLLAEDVVFKGPLMSLTGRAAYLELLGQFVPAHVSTRVLRQFVDGDEVCSINHLTVRSPAGEQVVLEMAEWFRLRDDRIAEHTLFYDPRGFAAAFGLSA